MSDKIPAIDYYIPKGIALEYQTNQPTMKSHSHNFIEIFYILSGKIEHNFNGKTCILNAGDFGLVDIDSWHSFTHIDHCECEMINCIFYPSFIDISLSSSDNISKLLRCREIQYRNNIPPEFLSGTIYHENDDKIKKLLLDMQTEFFRSEYGYLKILKSKLVELLIYFIRYIHPDIQTSIDSDTINIAISYMEKNFYTKITLEEVSNVINYTPQYFCSKFKQETGYSFSEYMQKIRIGKSCQLLQDTNMKITEIAEAVGYSDIRYFEKIFRKYINRTPLQHRAFQRRNLHSMHTIKHGHDNYMDYTLSDPSSTRRK